MYVSILLRINLKIYLIYTVSGPPAWALGEGLITPHRKKIACYEMLHKVSALNRFSG